MVSRLYFFVRGANDSPTHFLYVDNSLLYVHLPAFNRLKSTNQYATMSAADAENTNFKENISFEDEMMMQRKEAEDYSLCSDCPFRRNINRAVRFAVWGQRSVENFVEFAAAAIIDKEGFFKDIPMKMLYFNSIKIQESRWEVLCEQKDKTPKQQASCKKSTENIIKIVNGLVVNQPFSCLLTCLDSKNFAFFFFI